jgi:fused-like protein
MMRHSDYFYGALEQYGLLARLVPLGRDPSGAVRKFASFAVGNAAFHSALLYPHLAPAIGPLVDLLSDSEEKTRANAAGALGNLVRNSSELCGQMIAAGVLDALLALVQRGAVQDLGDSSVKIALFSLGNLSVHGPCRAELHRLNTPRLCEDLIARAPAEHMAAKYAQRLLQKLA